MCHPKLNGTCNDVRVHIEINRSHERVPVPVYSLYTWYTRRLTQENGNGHTDLHYAALEIVRIVHMVQEAVYIDDKWIVIGYLCSRVFMCMYVQTDHFYDQIWLMSLVTAHQIKSFRTVFRTMMQIMGTSLLSLSRPYDVTIPWLWRVVLRVVQKSPSL